jgi:two-component sensor histidine kinase
MATSRLELFVGPRFAARAAGAATVVIACLVITGWRFDIALLKTLLPGLPAMVLNIAVTFLLAGAALWLRAGKAAPGSRLPAPGPTDKADLSPSGLLPSPAGSREPGAGSPEPAWRRGAGQVCALLVLAIGLMRVADLLFGWETHRLPALLIGMGGAPSTGPRADVTAGFLFIGLALLFLDWEGRGGRSFADEEGKAGGPSQLLALAAGAIALVALAGCSYGAPGFDTRASGAPAPGMAPHTAVAFLILCAGILCVHPDRGLMRVVTSQGPGGVVARRLLPAALFLPLVLGALRLEGQRAGFYGLGLGLALFAVANVFTSAGLVWWIAALLHRTDADRRQAEQVREELLAREARRSEQLKLAVREAHHRIKNNLQAISDLLYLGSSSADSATPDLLRDTIHRVRAIALVHDLLCHDSDVRTVDARTMAERLVPAVLKNGGHGASRSAGSDDPSRRQAPEIELDLQVPSIPLSSRVGTDLALILNELVTNAVKHAFAGRRMGHLDVSLREIDDGLRLRVRDDGPGLPSGFDLATDAHMGLTVVRTLTERDLKGTLSLTSDDGLIADVWFPW